MRLLVSGVILFMLALPAQTQELGVVTIERPPFVMLENGKLTGFSIDLWHALAADMGKTSAFRVVDSFPGMLAMVASGEADAAVANITITLDREKILDFSQPIFDSGLQIMIPADGGAGPSLLRALFSGNLLIAIALAFAALWLGGMLMWYFERNKQEYFAKSPRRAMFPAFWWALNLVVNGGFEERVPQSRFGRVLAVFLVISSLFLVSVFVARITATMTVDAIQSAVNSLNDLHGKRVGTTTGSTAARYLEARNLRHAGYETLDQMITAFEAGKLDAVVFDAPVLAYYVNTRGRETAMLAGPVFRREQYGIALPTGSPLAEAINQSLLNLRENGTYDDIHRKWFGSGGGG